MVWEELSLLQKIGVYGFVLAALFAYAKMSHLRIHGHTLPFPYRVGIALFFPLVFMVFFLFGAVLLVFILILVTSVLFLSFLMRRMKE